MDIVYDFICRLDPNILAAIIAGVISVYIALETNASIHESNKELEKLKIDLEKEQKRREQAASVAEVLAEWIAVKDNPTKENILRLQKGVWEVTFWLPDKLAKKFNAVLRWEEDEKIEDLIYEVRAYILYGEDENKAKELFKRGDKVWAYVLDDADDEGKKAFKRGDKISAYILDEVDNEKTFSPRDIVLSFKTEKGGWYQSISK